MLCRFKRGSQRAGPSDQPSASGLFLAQSLIGPMTEGEKPLLERAEANKKFLYDS